MFGEDSAVLPDLRVVRHSSASLTLRHYDKYSATMPDIMLGEVDFLAGAKTKVDQMLERARRRLARSQRQRMSTGPAPPTIIHLMGDKLLAWVKANLPLAFLLVAATAGVTFGLTNFLYVAPVDREVERLQQENASLKEAIKEAQVNARGLPRSPRTRWRFPKPAWPKARS